MAATTSGGARVVRSRINLRERIARLWRYRELLVSMVRTELKVRYKNSALGFAWSLVNPLLYLVVFYVAFDLILGSAIPAFPLFLLSGLLIWNLFSAGLGTATGAIVGNAGLVNKVRSRARSCRSRASALPSCTSSCSRPCLPQRFS